MTISETIRRRYSARAFLTKPVARNVVETIMADAGRSPSGGNLQPWHVHAMSGDTLARFKTIVAERAQACPEGENPDPAIYPATLSDPYRARRFKNGEDLYATLGIVREEKALRLRQLAKNYAFFDAPVGLLFAIDRQMESRQWLDLGIFMQSVMLLAEEHGLATCPQAAWARWHETAGQFLGLLETQMVVCGMALGYADPDQAINRLRTDRADLSEFMTLSGF